jgi:hypothetical protein
MELLLDKTTVVMITAAIPPIIATFCPDFNGI